jgi:hypothetical protein
MKVILLAIIMIMVVSSLVFADPLDPVRPPGSRVIEAADGSWYKFISWYWIGNTLYSTVTKWGYYCGHFLVTTDSWSVENPLY